MEIFSISGVQEMYPNKSSHFGLSLVYFKIFFDKNRQTTELGLAFPVCRFFMNGKRMLGNRLGHSKPPKKRKKEKKSLYV